MRRHEMELRGIHQRDVVHAHPFAAVHEDEHRAAREFLLVRGERLPPRRPLAVDFSRTADFDVVRLVRENAIHIPLGVFRERLDPVVEPQHRPLRDLEPGAAAEDERAGEVIPRGHAHRPPARGGAGIERFLDRARGEGFAVAGGAVIHNVKHLVRDHRESRSRAGLRRRRAM